MSLSCSCPDLEYCEWFFIQADDFTTLQTSKRKRCKSCNELIDIGAMCLKFNRYRHPKDDIERYIYGYDDAEIPIASYYHCESCGDQYFNLTELGFCIDITDNIFDLLKEYQESKK